MNKVGLILILVVFAFACKKEKDTDPGNQNPTGNKELEYISASPWLAYRIDMNNINVWDFAVESCQKDNTYRFYKDSTLMLYENTEVCSGEPDSSSSYWYFYDDKKKLIGNILGTNDTAGIVTLSATELKLSITYSGNPAIIYFKKP